MLMVQEIMLTLACRLKFYFTQSRVCLVISRKYRGDANHVIRRSQILRYMSNNSMHMPPVRTLHPITPNLLK